MGRKEWWFQLFYLSSLNKQTLVFSDPGNFFFFFKFVEPIPERVEQPATSHYPATLAK